MPICSTAHRPSRSWPLSMAVSTRIPCSVCSPPTEVTRWWSVPLSATTSPIIRWPMWKSLRNSSCSTASGPLSAATRCSVCPCRTRISGPRAVFCIFCRALCLTAIISMRCCSTIRVTPISAKRSAATTETSSAPRSRWKAAWSTVSRSMSTPSSTSATRSLRTWV